MTSGTKRLLTRATTIAQLDVSTSPFFARSNKAMTKTEDLSTSTLVIRYASFALIATLANLGAQRSVFWLNESWFFPAMLAGTAVGLVVKYVLDKRWIFYDAIRPARQEAQTFALYTATGVITTLIFWGSESAFWFIWRTHEMRELGAVLGLTIGYVIKFNLDRRLVFGKPARPD